MMFGVFALWIPFYLVNSDRRKETVPKLSTASVRHLQLVGVSSL